MSPQLHGEAQRPVAKCIGIGAGKAAAALALIAAALFITGYFGGIRGAWAPAALAVVAAAYDVNRSRTTPEPNLYPSVWPCAIASLAFSGLWGFIANQYSLVHWHVAHQQQPFDNLFVRHPVWELMASLAVLKLVASGLAVAFGLWGLRSRPRWAAFAALAVSLGVLSETLFFIE